MLTDFARISGCRSGTMQTPDATFNVVVAAARKLISTNGSAISPYNRGHSPPVIGNGIDGFAGRTAWSGIQNESKPAASTSRARVIGSIV